MSEPEPDRGKLRDKIQFIRSDDFEVFIRAITARYFQQTEGD